MTTPPTNHILLANIILYKMRKFKLLNEFSHACANYLSYVFRKFLIGVLEAFKIRKNIYTNSQLQFQIKKLQNVQN